MLDEYMLGIGYSSFEVDTIKNIYPISKYSESTTLYNLKNLYNYLKNNNISNEDFVFITMTVPSVIIESIENIKIKVFNEVLSLYFTYFYTKSY